jgi:hypothetical protein
MAALWKVLLAVAALATAPAQAGILASATFDAGDEGWLQGGFDGPDDGQPDTGVVWTAGAIVVPHDYYSYAGFIGSEAFSGDLTAARGGTLSFDLSDAINDGQPNGAGVAWTAYVSLYGANGMLIYGGLKDELPAVNGLTHFSIILTAANFYTDGNLASGSGPTLGGRPVTQEEFDAVFANVARLGIPADFSSSANDYSTLDNVVLTSGVPEPASWAMMIGGLGAIGVGMRRHANRPLLA